MESTNLVALRTVVVLACVVTLPMLAVVGTSHWSELSDAWVQVRDTWNAAQTGQPLVVGSSGTSAAPQAGHVQPGGPVAPIMVAATPGSSYTPNRLLAGEDPNMAAGSNSDSSVGSAASIAGPRASASAFAVAAEGAKQPAPFWAANPLAAPLATPPGPTTPATADSAADAQMPLSQRALLTPPDDADAEELLSRRPGRSAPPAMPGLAAADASWASSDRLARVPHRLQELGALHYRLETCAADEGGYRFLCAMPAMADGRPPQSFQATSTDPVQAMEQVLQQIEIWSLGGSAVRG